MTLYFGKSKSNWYFAPNSTVVGDVEIGTDSSIWFNVVIRGDIAPIRIGRRVNVQDQAVIHCDNGIQNVIEDDVCIGHSAIVHGKFVGAGSLIAMGSRLLGRSKVGRGCIVAAGAVLAEGSEVPDGMVAMGVPAKIIRPVRSDEIELISQIASGYVELAGRYFRDGFVDVTST